MALAAYVDWVCKRATSSLLMHLQIKLTKDGNVLLREMVSFSKAYDVQREYN